jgi:hypothetical protein
LIIRIWYQPGYALAAEPNPFGPQFGVNPRATVGAPAGREHRRDPFREVTVLLLTLARPSLQPGVEPARRDADHPAQ